MNAVRDFVAWHLREKREHRRSTSAQHEEERVGPMGAVVAVLSVLVAIALVFGGFYLAVVGAA